jgi:hypothetical protein
LNSLAPEFHQDLTSAAQRREPLEDRTDRLLDSSIRVDLDLSAGGPTVACWQIALEFAAAGLLPHGLQGSLLEQVKLKLIHCPLQSKEQSVIRRTRIVHPFRIDHDGAHQSTQLDQVMPVPAIPRQTRRFNAEDRSNLTATDLRDQALKAWTINQAGSRFAKVVINGNDVVEAKLAGIVGESILTALAFEVVHNLDRGGLPDIHHGAAAEMIWRDFVAQCSFLPSSSTSVPATLSNKSARICSSSRRLSAGTGTGSSG